MSYGESSGYKIYLPESTESLLELTSIKLLVAVKVHSLEDSFETSKTDSTLLLDAELELEIQLSHLNV
jgi:hypothetical protein